MEMLACYMEADEKLIEKMKNTNIEDLTEMLHDIEDEEELDICDIDKMWDGLHCLLTGNTSSDTIDGNPFSYCINGEKAFSDDADDDFIAYTTPKRLKEILKAMEEVDVKKLRENFSAEEFDKKDVYPKIWNKADEDRLFEELISAFEELKEFYKKTCEKSYGVIVSILWNNIMNTLPEIKKSELENLEDTWDYLFVILEKYFAMIKKDNSVMKNFTGKQHTLMAYNYLCSEVTNGGFLQLIHNGYGAYVFDSPFINTLKEWGLLKTAEITEKAEGLYNKHKDEITKEMSIEEFAELYKKIKYFEPIDNMFFETDESDVMKEYIEKNRDKFFVLTD